eukprot:scaffold1048_cov135-Skeletonema_marinoi.AAC.11
MGGGMLTRRVVHWLAGGGCYRLFWRRGRIGLIGVGGRNEKSVGGLARPNSSRNIFYSDGEALIAVNGQWCCRALSALTVVGATLLKVVNQKEAESNTVAVCMINSSSMNIEIVPNLNSGEEEGSNLNESPHHHEGTTAVIENIDTITNNNNNNDEDGGLLSAAVSDDTSATSIASNLSDGNPRPRSASLHITPSNHNNTNGDHRPSSIPRLRPRSNPRTRTPMRHESPLLVISPIVAAGSAIIAENDGTGGIANHHRNGSEATAQLEDGDTNNNNEQFIRNIFHTRSSRARRLRAGSIPEEIVEDDGSTIVVVDDNTSLVAANNDNIIAAGNQANNESTTSSTAATNNNTTRTAGRFFTQAVATTSTRRRRTNRTTERNNTTQQQRTLSTKQNPSHRKIRRWKNDAFIGTPSEHVHTMLMTKGGEEEGWNEFPYMPNHPLEYNSEFSKLSVDRSRGGEKVRERFVKGEVASADFAVKKKNGSGEEEVGEEVMMQRRIVTKCRHLGIPPKVIMDESKWGKVLYDKLGMRIQSILSRSCSSADSNASRIVCTFESYLVSLALHSKLMTGNDDDDNVEMGFPPLQPQAAYDVFQDILASPPRIVMRNKLSSSSNNNNNNCNNQRMGKAASATAKEVSDMNKCGVLIPTVHFYFPTEGQDGSSRRSSAFHRILLYAVCQFHGLETSSSVVPEKKLKRENGRRRGQQNQNREVKGSMKVVTVQAGVLLAPSIKLLDFVCT